MRYEADSMVMSIIARAFAHPWLTGCVVVGVLCFFLWLCYGEIVAHEQRRTDDYLDMMDGEYK